MVVDMLGLIRGKQIKVSKLRELTDPVITLPKSIMLQNSMGENFIIPSISTVDPDYFAHGITGTLMPALWSSSIFMKGDFYKKKKWQKNRVKSLEKVEGVKKAHVFLNLMDNQSRPFIYNGRELVRQMTELIKKEFGYRVTLALELEFYLFAQKTPGYNFSKFKKIIRSETHIEDYQMLEPVNHLYHYPYFAKANADCYGINSLESIVPFTDKLIGCLNVQGIETDGLSSEYGRGQFEVNLKHVSDPVLACDQTMLLKHSLKTLAKSFDLNATFMAVPNLNSPNGMHINISLQDEKGHDIFFNEPPIEKSRTSQKYISEVMMYALGGLETTANDGMLIYAPNFNSYKRYYCQGYSPGNIGSWGINNRTVSLRVPHFNKNDPNFKKKMRLEHRLAGADCNPYLATAAVLGGIYWGLKKKILPSRIEKQSTYRTLLWESEIPSMVSSLQYWKRKQNVFRHLFGSDFCDTFYTHRITEWNYFLRSLSQLDFDWYSQY